MLTNMKKTIFLLLISFGLQSQTLLKFKQLERAAGATSVVVTDGSGILTYTPTFPVSKWTNDAGYLTSTSASVYVPYSGATTNVNLGANNFTTTVGVYSGSLNVGGGNFSSSLLHAARFVKGTSTVDIGETDAGNAAIWLNAATPSTTNYNLKYLNGSGITIVNSFGGFVDLRTNNVARISTGSTLTTITTSLNVGAGTFGTSLLHISRFTKGTGTVDIGESTTGRGAIWLSQSTPNANNYSFDATATALEINAPSNTLFNISNSIKGQLTTSNLYFSVPTRIGSSTAPSATLDVTGTMSVSSTATLSGSNIFGTVNGANSYTWHTGSSGFTAGTRLMELPGTAGVSAIYGNQTSPSTTNYALAFQTGATNLNSTTEDNICINGTTKLKAGANGIRISNSVGGTLPVNTLDVIGTMSVSSTATVSDMAYITKSTNGFLGLKTNNQSSGSAAYSGVSFISDGVADGTTFIGATSSGNTYIGASQAVLYSQKAINLFTDANVPINLFTNASKTVIFQNANNAFLKTTSIGTISAPAASAMLEVVSTTQGFLPPRMKATQGSAISSPAEGLMIYVTDTNGTFTAKGWWGYDGAAWQKLNN